MARGSSNYASLKIVLFLLKVVGVWKGETRTERQIQSVALTYTFFMLIVAIIILGLDIYHCLTDFYAFTYSMCSFASLVIILCKVSIFLLRQKDIMTIISYAEEHFWIVDRKSYNYKVLDEVNKTSSQVIFIFVLLIQGSILTYLLTPVVENIGVNITERILPFPAWFNVPSWQTPYFEVLFTIEAMALIHAGICFVCFDNVIYVVNLQTAGQFQILQHRLEEIFKECLSTIKLEGEEFEAKINFKETYNEFKKCVIQHDALIWYAKKVNTSFTYIVLSQLFLSSVMLCMSGFQVFLQHGSWIRRSIFVMQLSGCFVQLFALTMTSDKVMTDSLEISNSAYNSNWHFFSREYTDNIRRAILLVMIRASRPCYIYAGGFLPVTIESFMTALGTTASYFALLRTVNDKME